MRVITAKGAREMVHKSVVSTTVSGIGTVRVVRMDEPFTLILVPGGSSGPQGEAGDFIALHPDGYPFVVSQPKTGGEGGRP